MADQKNQSIVRGSWLALRAADVQLYRAADDLSGLLISAMLVFSPWAFGTTQPWSIWTMNFAGYALGILLLLKLFIREAKGYAAPRWENYSAHSRPPIFFLIRVLAGLTLAILAYCLTSALNAGATYNPDTRLFEYHHCVNWLPHSFDSHRTWQIFWMYLGLAVSFWAICDWLSGMTANEERVRFKMENDAGKSGRHLPARLRWLLWVLCVNGALLGAEAIVQRAAGGNKLLFLVQPSVNSSNGFIFGPYAYRSNAAQYFNLLWPLGLGFWWTLQRGGGLQGGGHHVLLLCAAIMAACPVISSSRGGALVAAGILAVAVIFLIWTNLAAFAGLKDDASRRGTTALLALFLTVALGLAWYFGWDALEPRMEQIGEGYQGREAMYELARPMAADYPLFGTGPGTFATVSPLYRFSDANYWPEQLHNDWLETRITFGWVGTALLLAALGCIFLRRFVPGRIRAGRRFVTLAWLGLAGCLVHARFDFPLQIHSVLLLFLIICAILFTASGRSSKR
jgi:O-antigen ligase